MWPESSKLKQSIKDGKFELSERWKDHFERIRAGKEDVLFERAAAKVAERRQKKYEEEHGIQRQQPWLSKMLSSKPEL